MLKILDRYILKRYLGTFSVMLLLFIPIGILVDLSSKIDNIIESEAPINLVIYFGIICILTTMDLSQLNSYMSVNYQTRSHYP